MSVSEFIEPYLVEVGTFTLKEPMEFRESAPDAAWFREFVFATGAYPLYAQVTGDQVSLVSGPSPAVMSACDDPLEIGSTKLSRILVTPRDVESGRVQLDISQKYESAFAISDNNPYQLKKYVGNDDSPEWQEMVRASKAYFFKADLFKNSDMLKGYAAQHGFLDEEKLEKGQHMGARTYEGVILADDSFRRLTGHGFDHFSIPLHQVAERFEGKQGINRNKSEAVARSIIRDFKIPTKPKRHFGLDVAYP